MGYYTLYTKNDLNLRIKTEPVTDGVDAAVYVRLLFTHSYANTHAASGQETRHAVASAPTVTGCMGFYAAI